MVDRKYKIELRNTIIFFMIGLFSAGFILIFPDSVVRIALAYAVLVIFSGLIIFGFAKGGLNKTATYKPNRKIEDMFYGISDKFIRGGFIGVLSAVGFIILSSVKVFSIVNLAIPLDLPFALSANAFVVIIVAPVCETLAFTSLLSVLNLYFNKWVSLIIRGVLFSAYHSFAYIVLSNSTLSNTLGAFIGAFVFSVFFGWLATKYGAEADAMGHLSINLWNWNRIFGLLTIAG